MAEAEESKPLAGIGTALAGGTTVITGVLTFLGVKDGALDRILAEQRASVLLFGALIAFGIGCGVVVRVIKFPGSVPVWIVAPILGVAVLVLFWDINRLRHLAGVEKTPLGFTALGIALAVGLVLVLAGGYRISTGGALALFGVTAFVLGAYGAVGLSLNSKAAETTPTLTSPIVSRHDDGFLHLTTTAAADNLKKCDRLVVIINGDDKNPVASAGADSNRKASLALDLIVTGEMVVPATRTLSLRTTVQRWTSTKGGCSGDRASLDEGNDAEIEIRVPADPLGPSLSATWTEEGDLELTVSVVDVMFETEVGVIVASAESADACTIISSATFPLPASGDLTATLPVDVPGSTTNVVIGGDFGSSTNDCKSASTMPAVAMLARAAQAAPTASKVTTLAQPRRAYDSRTSGRKLVAGEERVVDVSSSDAATSVPEGVVAAIVTLTVTETEGPGGYLSAFPAGSDWTGTSSVNWFGPTQDVATSIIVGLDSEQRFTVRSGAAATHFIVDVTGYITDE